MLKEALKSNCTGIRYGVEFCEWKLPNQKALEEAYNLTNHKNKDFTYVTPRVSDNSLEKIRGHLDFLNKMGKNSIVVNDLSIINILEQYPNVKPILGRQLIYTPARCPWKQTTEYQVSFLTRRRVEKIFHTTNLNYEPTIRFFQNLGVNHVDIDWIPVCFQNYAFLVKKGLNIFVHLHLIPVTITRRCHTARFLKENDLENCSKPCQTRAFLLKQDIINVHLLLHGNTVFKYIEPTREEVKKLATYNISNFIFTMNPVTKIENQHQINALIDNLQNT